MDVPEERHQECKGEDTDANPGMWVGPHGVFTVAEFVDEIDSHAGGEDVDEIGEGLEEGVNSEEVRRFDARADEDASERNETVHVVLVVVRSAGKRETRLTIPRPGKQGLRGW